jgi:hypothetical protein
MKEFFGDEERSVNIQDKCTVEHGNTYTFMYSVVDFTALLKKKMNK